MGTEAVEGETDGLDDRFNQERVRMHRQLYSAISHDLKTPLASTIGALEIYQRMKAKLTPEKQEALILTALQEAYRLDNFVTNILDMGKLENRMVNMRKEQFSLARCVKGCVTNLETRLVGTKMHIEGPPEEITAVTDQGLLCRALALLIDNAIKYGGKPPVITVRYGIVHDGGCFIDVEDNGAGIPDEQKNTIFTKYTRFIKRDQQHAGTGLGLAICREIMNLLGGSVTVKNALHGGSIFTLTLPAA